MMMLAFLLGLSAVLPVQEPRPEELAARRAKKLAAPFLKAAPWTTDFDAALKEAAARKSPILAYFTRSYDQ